MSIKKYSVKILDKFNKLTILKEVEPLIRVTNSGLTKYRMLQCRCDCGNIVSRRYYSVVGGNTKSCGCLAVEHGKSSIGEVVNKHIKTHGLSRHSIYGVWNTMKSRCYNPNNHKYHRYGGRGIMICEEWRSDFNSFHTLAISNGYKKGLIIDRIENDGNYEPNNCRFISSKESANNTSQNIIVILNDKKMSLTMACEELRVSYGSVYRRMYTHGQSFTNAIDHVKNYISLRPNI